uniref:Flavin oxidoreductase n=1 Tax=Tetraselmis sp. GSL018 TaxID=582737 RepID=A0A061RWJ2_9CHLO|mmetsp:Transcript_26053/g.61987  ORF Transcript_26053/g.61987 Transcript_26053/m.61987 type:complete len:687 (+) Transcript_26053:144-2204(+)|eukprot:CAMPEP_0177611416 /NCGR_PEP_ID=MMETSP0419_2-20121207/20476_1 /TAXON_ID=582737 /ORGANISM="Tetraselmis sp., Strain GSL018" /LENGTH=686 /DNA_ID=CAMNT_0019107137 /DNA_START=117 /DNA_END=2177 /DNA_ORIENTATION=-
MLAVAVPTRTVFQAEHSRAISLCRNPRAVGCSTVLSKLCTQKLFVSGATALKSGQGKQVFQRSKYRRLVLAASGPENSAPKTEEPVLELSSRTQLLGEELTLLSITCKDRLAYEVEYNLQNGTTDNIYILQSGEAAVLLGLPDDRFCAQFLKGLAEITPAASVTHVVLPHFGPKRVAALKEIIAQRKDKGLRVLCGNAALGPLRDSLRESFAEGKDYVAESARNGATLNFGAGRKLLLTLTPTPRWPDHFAAYDPDTETLFTSKLFSSHVCSEEAVDTDSWDVLKESWKHYFDCTLAASAKQAKQALQKLQGYRVGPAAMSGSRGRAAQQIAPLHGPVVRYHAAELVREYSHWTEAQIRAAEEATVAVIYASAYGNTTSLAQAISKGLAKAGVGVESLNCELAGASEVVEVLERCSGFALGSPTLGGHMPTPVQEALGAILKDGTNAKEKPCGVFGSFGWSGEAIDMMHSALKDSGFTFAFDPIRCKFKPTMEMLQICEESGIDLAQMVLKQKKRKSREGAGAAAAFASSGTERAVGRIVGSLCVLTTTNEDASSAMLASWVSQASFSPPGITVAVAKDRAVEGLLSVGAGFVLSVLAEGRSKDAMKQMLKPFKPGEDRFAGYEVTKTERTGGIVIPEAAAYVECKVAGRMDTGDHWVVYATVDSGKVLDETAVTALHHRKTGTSY